MHDPNCDDLARHFLQDEPGSHDAKYEARVESLAEAIQQAVEGWFLPEG